MGNRVTVGQLEMSWSRCWFPAHLLCRGSEQGVFNRP